MSFWAFFYSIISFLYVSGFGLVLFSKSKKIEDIGAMFLIILTFYTTISSFGYLVEH